MWPRATGVLEKEDERLRVTNQQLIKKLSSPEVSCRKTGESCPKLIVEVHGWGWGFSIPVEPDWEGWNPELWY